MNNLDRCLCQDCLREGLADFHENPEPTCICGGDLCMCPGCIETLNELHAGLRGSDLSGMQEHVFVESWTPEGGSVLGIKSARATPETVEKVRGRL